MTNFVKTYEADGVLTLTISRPEKKNALTGAMYTALSDGLERAEREGAVKVVVLQGDGDSFTAGNDIDEFRAQAAAPPSEESPAFRFTEVISRTAKPLVAAVQGNAVGVGATMLLHCDLVYLAENARLITPFVNLALVPEAASSWLLPARIGYVQAYAMFALGEPLDAHSAVARGLANAVVPIGELRLRAAAAAATLAKRPAGALRQTKALMRERARMASQMEEEARLFQERLVTAEAREAFAAFAERRSPDFSKL
ncbi:MULTISPECIES: enoyl-CoA hydratase-related protein [unclassified Bradyrhizobium]|uniref:enoyl-CoA hydratase-related protein n=1 Tax=unclassified Bradyrhizobium TaxID=2631580 RepID=UPI0023061AB8|nr:MULTISPECIES: enoyl-CoA hydratase-related protein [unclassified Bradyrhizobium]MDA9451195.1 enoyl-CoA hydratase [Bradyrhizobium sp. CCBAU 21360]MDA9457574.1 enoyl-CoA hydratase [Bradyrhizobium sp. CCBAU 21359]